MSAGPFAQQLAGSKLFADCAGVFRAALAAELDRALEQNSALEEQLKQSNLSLQVQLSI